VTGLHSNAGLYRRAIQDIGQAADGIDDTAVDRIVEAISTADHVSVFGCGREGLQVRGFAMRLFHLGRSVSVVGEMVTPAIGKGDLLLVTAGPGDLATASALVEVAKTPVHVWLRLLRNRKDRYLKPRMMFW
jgi:6-phospho-3-hexuloisomerase